MLVPEEVLISDKKTQPGKQVLSGQGRGFCWGLAMGLNRTQGCSGVGLHAPEGPSIPPGTTSVMSEPKGQARGLAGSSRAKLAGIALAFEQIKSKCPNIRSAKRRL